MEQLSQSEARSFALEQMSKWKLIEAGWRFQFNSRKSHLGLCYSREKRIELSTHHVLLHSKENVKDTILHEIAHALHYMDYVNRGLENEFSKRVKRGKRWVRVVKPHGKEWKKFARLVGANPTACANASTTKVNKDNQKLVLDKWRLVIVTNTVEDTGYTCNRFLKKLDRRMMRNKPYSLKNLYLVDNHEWEECSDPMSLTFYQKPPQHGHVAYRMNGSRLLPIV